MEKNSSYNKHIEMEHDNNGVNLKHQVTGMDFLSAGEASSNIKRVLQLIGYPPVLIRRAAIAAYEAEMNIVIHAHKGILKTLINAEKIEIAVEDEGPGIADINRAMQEGYSTAPDHIREMGFGAGMGLPNIRNSVDKFKIASEVGKGTKLNLIIYNK